MSPIFRNFGQILLICFAVGGIQAGPAGLGAFFKSLEYGRPVLGVKIPFSWIDPSWKEGTIEIAEATIEPGGPGIWKLATQPDLILRGVSVSGPASEVLPVLQGLNPKGIYCLKIVQFSFRDPKQMESIDLQKIEIRSEKIRVQGSQEIENRKKLIASIFGKKIEIIDKLE